MNKRWMKKMNLMQWLPMARRRRNGGLWLSLLGIGLAGAAFGLARGNRMKKIAQMIKTAGKSMPMMTTSRMTNQMQ